MVIFNRFFIVLHFLIFASFVSLAQEVKDFYFDGEQELSKRKFAYIDLFLYPDSLEISYPKTNQQTHKISYQDIYSVKIDVNVGKEILKFSLIGGLVGFMIFAPLPPDFMYFGGGHLLLFWKSPVLITLHNGMVYKFYILRNHAFKKKINTLRGGKILNLE